MNAPAPARPPRRVRWSITVRTALFAWVISILTLLTFAVAIVPEQKRAFQQNLWSHANGITVSLRDVAAGAVVSEDYSSVVEHCTQMLDGDPSLDHIVLARHDGFALVHERSGWRVDQLPESWHPAERIATGGIIEEVPILGRRVYQLSQPFNYSGIDWGWIHVGLSLEAYDRSVTRVYWRTAGLAVVSLLIGLGASVVNARHLLRPVLRVQAVMQRVAGGDFLARAPEDRNDEIGQLAESVNVMAEALLRRDRTLQEANETLEQRVDERTRELREQIAEKERAHRELAETQQRLMQLSREAGRADIATAVLHNVGNVLNSVNVSANILRDVLSGADEFRLLQCSGDLIRTQGDQVARFLAEDPRGRLLPNLVAELADRIGGRRRELLDELAQLARNLEHVKEIVAVQQSYAKVSGVIERLPPAELFRDALRINHDSLVRHGVALTEQFAAVPALPVDRHQVLQTLVNLVSNAVHAVKARAPGERRITLRLHADADRVHFVVEDNGMGIARGDLARIFQHGFTTRKDGHGFGLHSGALAARALGGQLTAHSDGPDRGARFALELPLGGPARGSATPV